MMKAKRKLIANKTKGKEIDVLCPECHRETRHLILQSVNDYWRSDDHPEYYVDGATDYQIIECQGCLTISFRTEGWFSEEDGTSVNLYPKRTVDRLPIKDIFQVPRKLRRIYREIIDSYNNELYTLCAAGLRAIIEGICSEKDIRAGDVKVDDGKGNHHKVRKSNLRGKISGLAEKGILTKTNAEILHQHRFLGNDALHELAQPYADELKLATEIVEHVLENIYELPSKAKELQAIKKKRKR